MTRSKANRLKFYHKKGNNLTNNRFLDVSSPKDTYCFKRFLK